MDDPKWTRSDIADRLKNLFAEPVKPWRKAYLEAASVLATFSPSKLNPVGGEGSVDQVREAILDNDETGAELPMAVAIEDGALRPETTPRFSLLPRARRETLKRLIQEGRVHEAVSANPQASDDPVQQAMNAYLDGTAKPLEYQTLPELQATLQVSSWLEGLDPGVRVPALAEVQERIEWETLLKPFKDLVGEEFAGREKEMDALADYVGVFEATTISESAQRFIEGIFSIKRRPPLLIVAPGGMGKSTLIAEFVLTHAAAQYVHRFPFAYLDFDRPGLLVEEPITLLLDAVRQMAMQYPTAKPEADNLRKRWTEKIRQEGPLAAAPQEAGAEAQAGKPFPSREQIVDAPVTSAYAGPAVLKGPSALVRGQIPISQPMSATTPSRRSRQPFRVHDRGWFYDEFAKFVGSIKVEGGPVLLVLDTFEEVQFRSRAFVEEVFDLLEELQNRLPELRTVLAGRAPIKSSRYETRVLQLPPFDPLAAQAFLRKQGVDDGLIAATVAEQVGGSPLTLKLAARLLRVAAEEAGPQGIRNLETGLLATAIGDSVQAQLYYRILDHIHDDEARKLANPGLILRRITPDVILRVLAHPCGITVPDSSAAQRLFDKLAQEISLVESDEPGVLVHRSDVRAVMLDLLKKDDAKRARDINDRAIRYYAELDDPHARSEELYHLLLFDFDRKRAQERIDQNSLFSVLHSINELPEKSQAFLAALADVEREDRIWNKAELPDWESHAAREAREFLRLQKPGPALEILGQRSERTPLSPLYTLELDALLASQDFRTAVKKAEQIVAIARKQDSTSLLLDALARLYEATRGSMSAGDERTRRMTAVVQTLRLEISARRFEENLPLERFFSSGRPGDRIAAIALAQASPQIMYVPIALESIHRALSAFEQYHGMVLADKLAAALDRSQKMSVTKALQHPETVQITEADKSRWNLRKQILLKIEEPGDAQTAL